MVLHRCGDCWGGLGGGGEMMALVTKTGVYDLTMAQYHGQPADALCMGSSDAVILTNATPAHLQAAWHEDDDGSKASDLGTVIHALILEPHRADKQLAVVSADDWRTKAARELREDARARGRTPILEKDLDGARNAVQCVMDHPVAAQLLSEGQAERSWFAKDKTTGLYKKCRPDFFTTGRVIVDVKSVASCAPEFLQRRVFDGGWFQQAPWYCDVVERVDGAPANGYCWICVEQRPPHAVVVRRPPDTVLMHGHRLNQEAFATFARCVATNSWPAYGEEIEDLSLPSFALFRLEEAAVATEARGMEAVTYSRQTGASPFG